LAARKAPSRGRRARRGRLPPPPPKPPAKNPSRRVGVAGEPVEEDHTACGIPSAAETMVQLQDNGIPVTMVWTPFASANHWCVVTVPRNWRDTMNCTAEDFCRNSGQIILASKLGPQVAKMMVIS